MIVSLSTFPVEETSKIAVANAPPVVHVIVYTIGEVKAYPVFRVISEVPAAAIVLFVHLIALYLKHL